MTSKQCFEKLTGTLCRISDGNYGAKIFSWALGDGCFIYALYRDSDGGFLNDDRAEVVHNNTHVRYVSASDIETVRKNNEQPAWVREEFYK